MFSLGDRVKVEVLQVSVARRRIEMRLQDSTGRASDGKRGKRGKSDRRQPKPKKDRSERRHELRRKNERQKKRK
jgi:transcriptional accessory protein Tex/SPT6